MRNSTKLLPALAAILLLVPLSAASAQFRPGLAEVSPPSDRHGAWLSFGIGAGAENYSYSNDPGSGRPSDLFKPSFSIAAGGTVNPYLRLGGEFNAWVNQFTDANGYNVTESLVAGMLTGQVFPAPKLGFFVKGGLGISRSGSDVSGGYGTGEVGFSFLYGAGYEIKLSRNLFLTPAINVMNHRSSPGGGDPDNLGNLHERVITLGVGLTVQPGR